MTAQDRGWGRPGCSAAQLARVTVPGMVDGPVPVAFPLRLRADVAPLFAAMVRWLVAERGRLGLPPLTSSGGYNKRLQRGSATAWSNHSWGLAGDFNAAANPMQRALRTDMPPGTSAKARSLGLSWGGDWTSTKDPMHFEFLGNPADAARRVAALTSDPTLTEEDDDMALSTEVQDQLDRIEAAVVGLIASGINPEVQKDLKGWIRQLDANLYWTSQGVTASRVEQTALRAELAALREGAGLDPQATADLVRERIDAALADLTITIAAKES